MGISDPFTGASEGFLSRLLGRARRSRRSIENGLRQVLDESASPSCCSIEKVAHVRRLIEPTRNDPNAASKRS